MSWSSQHGQLHATDEFLGMVWALGSIQTGFPNIREDIASPLLLALNHYNNVICTQPFNILIQLTRSRSTQRTQFTPLITPPSTSPITTLTPLLPPTTLWHRIRISGHYESSRSQPDNSQSHRGSTCCRSGGQPPNGASKSFESHHTGTRHSGRRSSGCTRRSENPHIFSNGNGVVRVNHLQR